MCERTLTVNAYFSPPIVHWRDLRFSSFSDYQKFKNNSCEWKGNNSKFHLILWWGNKLDKDPYFMSQRELLLLRKRNQKHWKLTNISSPETCSFTDLWFDYRTFYSCSNCMKRLFAHCYTLPTWSIYLMLPMPIHNFISTGYERRQTQTEYILPEEMCSLLTKNNRVIECGVRTGQN